MAHPTISLDRLGAALLGVILFAQGTGKLFDPRGYFGALERFAVLPPLAVSTAGSIWIAAELAAGSGLVAASVAPHLRRLGLMGAVATLVDTLGYLFLTLTARVRGTWVPNCTCFGVFLPQPLSTSVLIQDVTMFAWAVWQLTRFAGG